MEALCESSHSWQVLPIELEYFGLGESISSILFRESVLNRLCTGVRYKNNPCSIYLMLALKYLKLDMLDMDDEDNNEDGPSSKIKSINNRITTIMSCISKQLVPCNELESTLINHYFYDEALEYLSSKSEALTPDIIPQLQLLQFILYHNPIPKASGFHSDYFEAENCVDFASLLQKKLQLTEKYKVGFLYLQVANMYRVNGNIEKALLFYENAFELDLNTSLVPACELLELNKPLHYEETIKKYANNMWSKGIFEGFCLLEKYKSSDLQQELSTPLVKYLNHLHFQRDTQCDYLNELITQIESKINS